jgi:hemerythrin-like domain-containing protein
MRATEILMDEHRLIKRVPTALGTSANRVNRCEDIGPAFFINAALFIKNFADGCHHRKEEGVLFVAMNESGIPPVKQEKVMADFERVEHDEIGEGVHEKYLALAEVLEKESLK